MMLINHSGTAIDFVGLIYMLILSFIAAVSHHRLYAERGLTLSPTAR